MSVATHLAISPAKYDARIRSLIPLYDELIAEVARALGHAARPVRTMSISASALVRSRARDGVSAGCAGLGHRCRRGDDGDRTGAARPSSRRVTMATGSFLDEELPPCDAIVASYSLHHIRTSRAKLAFYRRCYRALRPGGVLINGDCAPASTPRGFARDLDSGSRISARRSAAARADDGSTNHGPTRTRICRSPKRSA